MAWADLGLTLPQSVPVTKIRAFHRGKGQLGLDVATAFPGSLFFGVLNKTSQMENSLTFTINPDNESASVELFLRAMGNINRLLRDVDYALHHEKTARRWIIREIRSSAPTVTVEPLLGDEETVATIAEGVRIIASGADAPPDYFTEEALQDLKRMRSLFVGRDRARSILVSRNSHLAATIDEEISNKTDRILRGGFWNLGSLEGYLEEVNLHGRPSFKIWNRVSRTPVQCSFPDMPVWKTRVKELLERRVFVQGSIHYFNNGIPRSIRDIIDVQDSSPDPELPEATFGSIPDQVAADDPVAFVRSLRR